MRYNWHITGVQHNDSQFVFWIDHHSKSWFIKYHIKKDNTQWFFHLTWYALNTVYLVLNTRLHLYIRIQNLKMEKPLTAGVKNILDHTGWTSSKPRQREDGEETSGSYKIPTPVARYTCHSILFGTRFGMDGYGDTTFGINGHRTWGRNWSLCFLALAFTLKRQQQSHYNFTVTKYFPTHLIFPWFLFTLNQDKLG